MHLPARSRNALLMAALAIATFTAAPAPADGDDLSDIGREVAKRHDEAVARLQDWIALPSIAAENRGFPDGAEHMAKLARDAGFQQADGDPDRRQARRVRHARCGRREDGRPVLHVRRQAVRSGRMDARRRSKARIVDKPGVGKVMVGRGAVNQKGPQAAFLAALHAIRGAGASCR